MKVILSKQTDISSASASPESSGEASLLVGARFRKAQVEGEPDVYIATHFDKVDKLLGAETRHLNVMGQTEDQIVEELNRRYPSPRAECQTILRVDEISLTSTKQVQNKKYYGHTNWVTQKTVKDFGTSWVVLPRPMADVESVEDLMVVSMSVGPVLITRSRYNKLFGYSTNRNADDASFIVGNTKDYGNVAYIQINYNPKALVRRDFLQQRKKAEARLSGVFPKDVRFDLFACLGVGNWPNKFSAIAAAAMYKRSGWNNQTKLDFSVYEIVETLDLTQKLFPGDTWWRKATSGYRSDGFKPAIGRALLYVHGVEKNSRAEKQHQVALYNLEYQRSRREYLQDMEDRRELLETLAWENEGGAPQYHRRVKTKQYDLEVRRHVSVLLVSEEWPARIEAAYEKLASPTAGHSELVAADQHKIYLASRTKNEWRSSQHYLNLRLCYWLRREAKAAEIPLPSPAVIPISEAEKKLRHKKRLQARHKAARQRRKAIQQRSRHAKGQDSSPAHPVLRAG